MNTKVELENPFWGATVLPVELVAYTTKNYMVVVTPNEWRPLADRRGRELFEFSVVNKKWGTVEGGLNNLPGAITLCETLQSALSKIIKEPQSATLIGFPGKDSSE